MGKEIFLGKIKDYMDRDCVKYMEFAGFECDHYFGGLRINGACFSGGKDDIKNNINNFETILTKEELLKLFELNDKIKELGYGIKKGSDKYNQGMKILEEYENTILKKLQSEDNKKLFEKVILDEKEKMKDMWNLSNEDIEKIFSKYNLNYRDSSIIAYVYDSSYVLAEEYLNSNSRIDEFVKEFINYDKLGDFLAENECYIILDDGRVVELCY